MTIFHKFVFSGTDIFHFYVNACYRAAARRDSTCGRPADTSWNWEFSVKSFYFELQSMHCWRVYTQQYAARTVLFVFRLAMQHRIVFRSILCKNVIFSATKYSIALPPFSLIRDFGKQNGNVSKISVNNCVLSTVEIHRSQPLVWPSDLLYVMLAGCDFRSDLSIINTQDCRKL